MKSFVKEIARKMSLEIHQTSPRILSIQSHVVHGHAGNKSATFPLQLLGFEVDPINTVQFSTHSGYKHRRGTTLSNKELAELMEGLALNEVDYYTHLLTGYTRNPESLQQVAKIVKKLKEKNPNLIYVCDPVMGDNGRMYVPEEILPVYQDTIVPIADILTPNQYEAELLTGIPIHNVADALRVVGSLHEKGVKTVVISSSDLGDENHMIALASTNNNECYQITFPKIHSPFTGTGDLFAALFCAWFYKSNGDLKSTLENTICTVQGIIRDTYDGARAIYKTDKLEVTKLELRVIQNKRIIENPKVDIFALPLSELKTGNSY